MRKIALPVALFCFLVVIGLLGTACSKSYSLTVHTTEGGKVTKAPEGGKYRAGNDVTLTAVADTGWQFTGWTGDVSDATNPVTLDMDSAKDVTASFVRVYAVNTTTVGNGKVTKSPDLGNYQSGTTVTLTAVADPGWQFTGWTGDVTGTSNPATVRVDSIRNVTASFVKVYPLEVKIVGGGTVSRNPDRTGYEPGTVVTLTAVADPGWQFTGWTGDVSSTSNPISTKIESSRSIAANFVRVHALTVNITGNGNVTRTPDMTTYTNGTKVVLKATPAAGWEFDGWSGDVATDDASTITVTMDSSKTITATFSLPLEASFFAVANGVGVPEAAPYTSGAGLHPVVLISSLGDYHDWSEELPADWRPDTIGDTQLVVCVGEEQEKVIETRDYYYPNGIYAGEMRRYQCYVDVELREAKTGKVVAKKTLLGAPPRAFKTTERSELLYEGLHGDSVSFDQLETWLRPYIQP